MDVERLDPRRWQRLSPWVVLVVGLLATALMVQAAHQRAHARDDARFARLTGRTLLVIQRGLEADATLLRGVAGLIAVKPTASAAEFRTYARNLDLGHRYPGVRGVGFALALDDSPAPARSRLPPDARLWPQQPAPRSAIVLLEPDDPLNHRALGYDMTSDPVRRAAMESARLGGRAVVSGPVRLVQERDAASPGFLIYRPVSGADGRFLGWAYSPLRAADFFRAAFQGAAIESLADVEVFDGAPDQGRKLFETAPPADHPRLAIVRPIQAFGRTWQVRISTNRGFSEGPWSDAWPVAIAGLGLTLTLSLFFWLQSNALHRALGAEEEARRAQARAEVLLREVNHRVANSLQVVASLLELQRDALKSSAARDALRETKARIMAVARVHQRLFASDEVGRVDLKGYLESLTGELAATLDADGRRLKLIGAEVSVDAAKAVSAGIIVAELVTNAFKYAYGTGIPGEVRIRLVDGGHELRLSVEDDGVGFPPPGAGAKGTGLGMRIVRAMSQTLDGTLDMGPIGGGARVTLIFPSS